MSDDLKLILIFVISLFMFAIFFGGDPDLMDAIINNITVESCVEDR